MAIIFGDLGSVGKFAANGVGAVGDVTPGWDVSSNSSLMDHPRYHHWLQVCSLRNNEPAWRNHQPDLDVAGPGDPECRAKVVRTCCPPLIRCSNDRWVGSTGWLKKRRDIAAAMTKTSPTMGPDLRLLDADRRADKSDASQTRSKRMHQAAKSASWKAHR